MHLFNKCDKNADGNSFDVVYLYADMSGTFGLQAVTYFLFKYEKGIHSRFNLPFTLDTIDFALKKQNFFFWQ